VPQFDVFRNPGRQRDTTPFLVMLQNKNFDRLATRFIAPLVLCSAVTTREGCLAPRFFVAGQEVFMDVFNVATVLADRLGKPVASLSDEDSRAKLIRAIDEFIRQV
jgi:toxin CcdB